MKLIVGLGNPGKEYARTRHNVGFMIVDKISKHDVIESDCKFRTVKKFNAEILKARFTDEKILLVKPCTFMNRSGESVSSIADYYKILLSDIWIIHDDIDLPLGKVRIKLGCESAGHNGVESIIQHLKTKDFVRFRLGIGRPETVEQEMVTRFVLTPFETDERKTVSKLLAKAEKAVLLALSDSLDKAMSVYN